MRTRINKAIEVFRSEGISALFKSVVIYLFNRRPVVYFRWLIKGKLIRKEDDGLWYMQDLSGGSRFYFPYFNGYPILQEDYQNKIRTGYFGSEEFEIESQDIVFDVGAYIGITSIMAAEKAKQVYAIEPSPRALRCLRKNVEEYDNIEIIPYAVWNESTILDLNFGISPADDSLIEPDDGGENKKTSVQAYTIDEISELTGESEIDYLKIEAEGVEPEVVEGIEEIEVKKIAASGNEERYGETSYERIAEILRGRNYIVEVNKEHPYKMVYAYKR